MYGFSGRLTSPKNAHFLFNCWTKEALVRTHPDLFLPEDFGNASDGSL